jgi:hypothetical protein
MGEAKRRKQSLGKDYGKVKQPIIRGTEDVEEHVERFFEAWLQQLESLGFNVDAAEDDALDADLLADDAEFDDDVLQDKQQEMKQWIQGYLQPYRIQDRDKIAMGVLDPIYEELANSAEVAAKGDEGVEQVMKWIVEAASFFGMLKPYLSADIVKQYQEPLQSFYELSLKEHQAANDEEGIAFLQTMFADCLD